MLVEEICPRVIVDSLFLLVVIFAINLYYEVLLYADEISNIITYWMLPPKLIAQCLSSQLFP